MPCVPFLVQTYEHELELVQNEPLYSQITPNNNKAKDQCRNFYEKVGQNHQILDIKVQKFGLKTSSGTSIIKHMKDIDDSEISSNICSLSSNTSNNSCPESPQILCPDHQRIRDMQQQAINSFQNLTHLDISGNSAEKLDLRSLTRLEWLCCSNNQLEVLSLAGNSITYLDCSNNNLQSISIEPVPNNLSTLQISFNNLEDLPSWTWIVPDLSVIFASHNRLKQLDCKFQNCLASLPIRELHLHCNKIEFVSKDFIHRATRLKILNLSQNQIEHMPNFGRRCPIQELYMSRNRLQDSDERDALDFLSDCAHLRRLYLAFNKIENINERYLNVWKNLEELIICGNRINTLPSKISALNRLRVLRVHSNRLESAPNLTKMPSLKVVDLSHNNLRKVNLENLISGRNLSYLDISCNDRLTLDPEKLHNPKRPMNLVEVSKPRKHSYDLTIPGSIPASNKRSNSQQNLKDFPFNPPWELGFSELPDKNQTLNVLQFRDVNLSQGKEALFGIFDGGDEKSVPKHISKSISRLFSDEKKIEETNKFSLKYTLLNAMKGIRQQGNDRPVKGILCLMSMENGVSQSKSNYTLNIAMIGGMRCILIESGKKIRRLTDIDDPSSLTNSNSDDSENGQNNKNPKSSSQNSGPGVDNHGPNGPNGPNMSIPDPKILSVQLNQNSEYLLVGNAAIWKYVNEAEILEELEMNKHKKSVLIAKRITEMAQSHSCRQSLSLILVRFKWTSSASRGFRSCGVYEKTKMALLGDIGPLSYYSGCSSDYSDPKSMTQNGLNDGSGGISSGGGDSAIDIDDTDRSSASSNGNKQMGKKPSKNHHQSKKELIDTQNMNCKIGGKDKKGKNLKEMEMDMESLSNTSISHMSVEQFKCWEYMLEQNTKTLFKKELDSLSKGVFSRNQKNRKSVHFPYQDIGGNQLDTNSNLSIGKSSGGKIKSSSVVPTNSPINHNLTTKDKKSHQNVDPSDQQPGFYTLSKAKSLSHLFAAAGVVDHSQGGGNHSHNSQINHGNHGKKKQSAGGENYYSQIGGNNGNPGKNKSNLPIFGTNSGAFRAARARGTILGLGGGPNSAYFGNPQRLLSPNLGGNSNNCNSNEIQEIKTGSYETIEHESRLKKYWEDNNKITEL